MSTIDNQSLIPHLSRPGSSGPFFIPVARLSTALRNKFLRGPKEMPHTRDFFKANR